MKVKRFARVMALSLSLALAVPSVVPGAALTAEAATKEITLTKGSTKKLKVSTSEKVTWKSSKTSVATVNKNGKVTAKKVGTAKITATYGSKKKAWLVTVEKANKVYLNKTSATIYTTNTNSTEDSQVQLRVCGLTEDQQQEVTWSSSDVNLVDITVNPINASKATVEYSGTAKTEGTAVVTATYGNKKMTCTVTVVKIGTNLQTPVVYPVAPATYNTADNLANFTKGEKYDIKKATTGTPNGAGAATTFVSYPNGTTSLGGPWNDVKVNTLTLVPTGSIDASKAYMIAPGIMTAFTNDLYAYELTIAGTAPKKETAPYSPTVLNGVETIEFGYEITYQAGPAPAAIYMPSAKEEVVNSWKMTQLNQNNGYVRLANVLVNHRVNNTSNPLTALGTAQQGPQNQLFELKCDANGNFGFTRLIYSSQPITKFVLDSAWPNEYK